MIKNADPHRNTTSDVVQINVNTSTSKAIDELNAYMSQAKDMWQEVRLIQLKVPPDSLAGRERHCKLRIMGYTDAQIEALDPHTPEEKEWLDKLKQAEMRYLKKLARRKNRIGHRDPDIAYIKSAKELKTKEENKR
jgi:hypothetical protein